MTQFFGLLADALERDGAAVLATIVTAEGSAPRMAGARLFVRGDGQSFEGTVGGGILEARVLDACRAALGDGLARLLTFDLSADEAAGSDMICGGRVRLYVEPLRDSSCPHLAPLLRQADRLTMQGRRCVLVNMLHPDAAPDCRRLLLTGEGQGAEASGDLALEPAALAELRDAVATASGPLCVEAGGLSLLADPVASPGRVVIAGAGHVGRQVALMASLAGFRVTVLDDRPDFARADRLPGADEVRCVTPGGDWLEGLGMHEDCYVVIVTRGHRNDGEVLASALRTPARYVGMIGSRRKRDAVYRRLEEAGTPRAAIERVYSPIGLDIGAETPEEIAVSIVAELVQARAASRMRHAVPPIQAVTALDVPGRA
jgi:xanthine dehydrogenase accessory factor